MESIANSLKYQQGGGKITSASTELDVDLLKKRADRFGTVRCFKFVFIDSLPKAV